MEVKKRSAAITVLCMLLLMLSGQQVVAMSKFCRCYNQCYPGCRHKAVRLFCMPFCANKCSPNKDGNGGAAISCRTACLLDFGCGSPPTASTADKEACVRDCNQKGSHD